MTARRASFWGGLALVAVGVGILGYVAWALFGTNVVAKARQEQHVQRLTDQWRETEHRSAEGAGRLPVGTPHALIRVPRFGDDYVMPVLEGTTEEVLSAGFGHFEGSAAPGSVGNYALAAHRVTHGEPLRRMPDLRPGDQILVETRQAVYTYVLDTHPDALVVPFTATWVIDPSPVNPEGGVQPPADVGDRLITLTTCSELFHTDNRTVVFGHLESAERKA